ncbi:Rho GTPase activation protein [Laetiporus sulphureus 93-53]|uniref:Rho GTPase activation protein n=1 Tax=Laetiporus sulphureus 93-53 TaxID=1314785 RepID=A0A165BDQ5_9APHY|nr:Rho GTPase activation protein [Laetiporus sulphureus 93-53]KZT00819.1 Rho GTPase activation protein [Laetiporus sulphureus 93-53]
MATSSSAPEHSIDKETLVLYSKLFGVLRHDPEFTATLCEVVGSRSIDSFLQTVMFSLYVSNHASEDELLLLSMIQALLASRIGFTTELTEFLHTNTPVSRALTVYSRRASPHDYLKRVLAERISHLVAHDQLNVEIDPVKVYAQMVAQIELDAGSQAGIPHEVSADVAAEDSNVQAIIAQRLTMLTSIAEGFLSGIIQSIDQIANLLTSLAAEPSYENDWYMAKPKPFVDNNQKRTDAFLYKLCDVDDFDSAQRSGGRYRYKITVNELYNNQRLLQQHYDAVAADDDGVLRRILNELGRTPSQLPHSEDFAIELRLSSG